VQSVAVLVFGFLAILLEVLVHLKRKQGLGRQAGIHLTE